MFLDSIERHEDLDILRTLLRLLDRDGRLSVFQLLLQVHYNVTGGWYDKKFITREELEERLELYEEDSQENYSYWLDRF